MFVYAVPTFKTSANNPICNVGLFSNLDTTTSVLLLCIQRSSLFNQKMRVDKSGNFKDHYFVRCDYCNKKSHPHQVLNFPVFVDWMKNHILECDNSSQGTKEPMADKDLTIDFGKMKVSHFNAWHTTVFRYLQAVQSSSCKGGCDDVYFTRLLQEKDEVSMHHFYSSVGVELMQQDGALEKKNKLELTQVRNAARTLLPLTGDGPHWILQDTKRKCYHFDKLQVLKMYDSFAVAMVQNESRPIQADPLWRTKHQEKSKIFLKTVAKYSSIQFPAR
jgi:hypothetical protein